MQECLLSLPERYGVNPLKVVNWYPSGPNFKVDRILFNVPAATAFTQVTIDVPSDRFFHVIRLLSEVDGVGFATYTIRSYVRKASDYFEKNQISDPHAQSFLFLVYSYIASAQFCELPYQHAHSIFGLYETVLFGRHPAFFDFGKRFTDVHGFLARSDFASMFASLPESTRRFLQKNLILVLESMLKTCVSDGVSKIRLFKFGFSTVDFPVTSYSNRVCLILLGSTPPHPPYPPPHSNHSNQMKIRKGPMIKEWIDGFMYSDTDLLRDHRDFESMGAMKTSESGAWVVELRRGPADTVAVPVPSTRVPSTRSNASGDDRGRNGKGQREREGGEGGDVEAVQFGVGNLWAINRVVKYLTEVMSVHRLTTMTKEEIVLMWDTFVKDGVRILKVDERLLRGEVQKCLDKMPRVDPELVEVWIRRHL